MSVANGDGNESEVTNYTSTSTYTSSALEWSEPCRHFELHEILSATENFNESLVIGKGGFGKVYKGSLVNGSSRVAVAIKRWESSPNQGATEFWTEVKTLAKVRHCHVVPLLGYCDHENEMILVYEYIPNGTLYAHLHTVRTLLSWVQRLRICIGAARALDYLHTGMGIEFGVIHQDVKSSNILLNKSWTPKITDLGMSKLVPPDQQSSSYVSTLVKGTFGYLDPDYFFTGKLSRKSDVYAFGVVLLEVLCRKRAVERNLDKEHWGLARWALDSIKDGRLKHIVDSNIRYEISPKCLKGFAQIAERCLDINPKHRPTMTEVVFTLQSILNIQEKSNSFLQATGKTKSGRRVTDDQNAGMELGFRMPNNRKLLILRDNILQRNVAPSFKHYPKKIFQLTNSCFGSIQIFGPKDLKKATNNYADNMILGKGAQGTVYKGILPDKRVVAIKRHRILSQSRLEQLITEIVILESINHNNVVRLLGCCFKTEDAFLVYEFASNGSLHHLLHKGASGTGILSWDNRLKMAHETADALAYLHTYEIMSIIHRDVKSANILLDENYTAKISDFGSSMLIPLNHGQVITTDMPGTPGYVDPEYYSTSQPTNKSDVYGFGVVLTELLTGKKPFDREIDEDDKRLSTYFVKKTKDDGLLDVVDPQVLQEATDEQLSASRDLVYRCLEPLGVNRPSMKEVTMELDRIRKSGKRPGVS